MFKWLALMFVSSISSLGILFFLYTVGESMFQTEKPKERRKDVPWPVFITGVIAATFLLIGEVVSIVTIVNSFGVV